MFSGTLSRSEFRTLLKNSNSLTCIQIANIFLPLLTIPYLLRVLPPHQFGLIVFAGSVIQYFLVVTDFGFNFTATREISLHRDDSDHVSRIFTGVLLIKLNLMVVCLIVLGLILWLFAKLGAEWPVFLLSFGSVFAGVLMPVWLFQGQEQMSFMTLFDFGGKLIYLLSLFVFIHQASDYLLVPFLFALTGIGAALAACVFAMRRFGIGFRFDRTLTGRLFRESVHFFFSRIAITLYTVSSTIIIGALFPLDQVAYYALAEKVSSVLRSPYDILNTVLYPFMVRTHRMTFLRKLILLSWLSSCGLYICIFLGAPLLIRIIGGEDFQEPSTPVLRILALAIMCISVHLFLGSSVLVASGREKIFNRSTLYGCLVYILLITGMFFLGWVDLNTVAAVTVAVDVFILLYRVGWVRRLNLMKEEG